MEIFRMIILTLHVLGAVLIVGSVLYSLSVVFRKEFSTREIALMRKINKFGSGIAGSQFLTGAILVGTEWDELGHKPLVWVKVALWVLDGIIAKQIIDKKLSEFEEQGSTTKLKSTIQISTLVLLIVVLVIATCGVSLAQAN